MNFIKDRIKLKEDLIKLIEEKNADELRKIGCDSNVMSRHNLIAEAYLKAACRFGNKEAYTDLGVLYHHHFEMPDHKKGFKKYLIAAKLGDRRAISLYIRDMYWFQYDKDYDEIIQLAVKFKEPSGVSEYAYRLLIDGKITEAVSALESIQYENPKILIEIADIKLRNQYDEDEIIEDLIKFSENWYGCMVEMHEIEEEGDDEWFPYYCMDMQNQRNLDYDILSTILKREADNANIRASFAYSLFALVGICLETNNFAEYEHYMNKALNGGLKDGQKIKEKFDNPFSGWVEEDEEYDL